jgi:hypothetical protein
MRNGEHDGVVGGRWAWAWAWTDERRGGMRRRGGHGERRTTVRRRERGDAGTPVKAVAVKRDVRPTGKRGEPSRAGVEPSRAGRSQSESGRVESGRVKALLGLDGSIRACPGSRRVEAAVFGRHLRWRW